MATPYKFTQPIRYYKANDPYFYQVDNLPIMQLEENILYIKNQVEGKGSASTFLTENSEINITNIKQLKPKPVGGRFVGVNPGTFTSRVNDAFDIRNPLSQLALQGTSVGGTTLIPTLMETFSTDKRDEIWSAFISTGTTGSPYNLNGLEYTYTFHTSPGGMGGRWSTSKNNSEGSPDMLRGSATWPGQSNFAPLTPTTLGLIIGKNVSNATYTYENLSKIHLGFVKMWRGVFRTAVVDFDGSEIEIPEWKDDDFYYHNSAGSAVPIPGANQRIDLLVLYSVPIDSNSAATQDFSDGFCDTATTTQKTMYQPTLGIIRGAGIGISKSDSTSPVSIQTAAGCNDPGAVGSTRIVANINDKDVTANLGIKDIDGNKVHGSFPSPDDLVNMAPLLALNIDADDYQLIGQTALPLAYIVVNKGSTDIVAKDIIDIRPFLRTTEFTYNERAGVAAANPPLSLANPAVGAFQLQDALDNVTTDVAATISDSGRAIYTDYVMGGLAYGVEGTLLTMNENNTDIDDPWGTATTNTTAFQASDYLSTGNTHSFAGYSSSKAFLDDATQKTREAFLEWVYRNRQTELSKWIGDPNTSYVSNTSKTYLGLATGQRNIPLLPEWDMPMDSMNFAAVTGESASSKPTWWMWFEGQTSDRPLAYVPGAVPGNATTNTTTARLAKAYGFGYGDENVGQGSISVVSKKINMTFPSWVNDYDILVEYVNCGPVAAASRSDSAGATPTNVGLGSGLSVNKGTMTSTQGVRSASFQINSAAQPIPQTASPNEGMVNNLGEITDKVGVTGGTGNTRNGAITEALAYQWLSYAVCLPEFKNNIWNMEGQTNELNALTRHAPKFGAAYYPTVKFTIIGYEASPTSRSTYGSGNTLVAPVDAPGTQGNLITGTPLTGVSKITIE